MPEGILYALKMLIVVALIFLGLCALAVALLIIGAIVIAIRTSRKANRKMQNVDKEESQQENFEEGENNV